MEAIRNGPIRAIILITMAATSQDCHLAAARAAVVAVKAQIETLQAGKAPSVTALRVRHD